MGDQDIDRVSIGADEYEVPVDPMDQLQCDGCQ